MNGHLQGGRTRLTRRQFLYRAAGGAVVALSLPEILAACTGAGETTSTSTQSGSATGTTGGTLRVGWSSEPDTMNPLTSYSTEALEVQQLIYDKLMDYDPDLNIVQALAETTEVSDDGTTITYTLRSGVNWHDGEPLTADDVVFTFSTIAEQGSSGYAQWLAQMTDVAADGDDIVMVTFSQPQAFDPALSIPILPKHIWEGMSNAEVQKFANDDPIGSGPYRFGAWERGQTVSVERNEDFWGTPPGPDAVLWVLYQNEDVMAQSLRGGEVDILPEVPPTIWDGLGTDGGMAPVSLPGFSFHHIGINMSSDPDSDGNPLLLDVNVRQALSYATDRNQLVEIALAGHGQPGSVLLPPAFGEYMLEIPPEEQIDAKPDKANELLDQAGYTERDGDGTRLSSDGQPLRFRLIAIESTTVDVRAAQLFRDSVAKVGIALDLQTMDENTLGSLVYETTDWDIFVWGWDSGVNDPDYMLGIVLSSQIGGNNDIFYANPDYDALYDQQATELDHDRRVELVHEAQRLFYEDCAYIVMWYQDKLQAYRSDLWGGFGETPGGIIFNFTRANYVGATQA